MTARPRAVVLVTGSELVRGGKTDANGPFIARELTRLGLEPDGVVTVGDREELLEAALAEGLRADLCVISGGLGPTHDDRTVELLARATGRPLYLDEVLRREIEGAARAVAERIGRRYADFEPGVRKQASLPEGAISLGLAGTAPAVVLEHAGGVAVALPGPPGELRRLWSTALASAPVRRVLARAREQEHRVARVFGPSESAVAHVLERAGGEQPGVEATVCAADLEVRVDLYVEPGGRRHADALEEALAAEFGLELFARDERPPAELVLDLCRERGLTVATAESCTGGLAAARLTEIAGSSDVFLGGIVAYSDEAKRKGLGVAPDLLARHGAVSSEVAAAMASGAREAFGADLAVSVTGIAGPGGATPDKPVGLVFVHVESADGSLSRGLTLPGDRSEVRSRATAVGLHLLRELLSRSVTLSRAPEP